MSIQNFLLELHKEAKELYQQEGPAAFVFLAPLFFVMVLFVAPIYILGRIIGKAFRLED